MCSSEAIASFASGPAGRALAMLLFALSLCAPLHAQRGTQLVPANFNHRTDSQGFLWDIQQNGFIQNGTNNCFSGAEVLNLEVRSQNRSQNSSFNTNQAMMTPDGSEYVLTGMAGVVAVTRRVKVDAPTATVRYVEILQNTTAQQVQVELHLINSLGRSQVQTFVTDQGNANPNSLGPKEQGVVGYAHPSTQQLAQVYYLAGADGKIKPRIQNQNNARFTFSYQLVLGPRQTAAVLHGIGQRRLQQPPDKRTLDDLFKPFESRKWTSDLPRDVRDALVNAGRSGLGSFSESDSLVTLDSLGVTPGSADVLAIGEQTRLHGAAAIGAVALETAFGPVEIPIEDVAAIVGEKRTGGKGRVFLRDGQVIAGRLVIEDLRFTMNTGLELNVDPAGLDRLVMHASPADGKPEADAFATLETLDGDRLALARSPELLLAAKTPWGQRDIALDDVLRLEPTEDPIGHRLQLRDGSRLFAFLGGEPLPLSTLLFGEREFHPSTIRSITANVVKSEGDDPESLTVPYALLAGDNVLVGQIDLDSVHFIAVGQAIPVPPNQIRVLRSTSQRDESSGLEHQAFEAELWDGGTIAGYLTEPVLPLRSGEWVSQIPVRDILEVHVPTPTVPAATRTRIGEWIRDLGDADYERREAASRALAEFGYLAKQQLTEAVRVTSDPEVRRRAEALLEAIED